MQHLCHAVSSPATSKPIKWHHLENVSKAPFSNRIFWANFAHLSRPSLPAQAAYSGLNDLVTDGVVHQLGQRMQAQLQHDVRSVRFGCIDADA